MSRTDVNDAGVERCRLVLSDVDGTLVTSDKELTTASIDAAAALRDAGIGLAITSGRPPQGMQMLVEPLRIETPIAAFNGGMFVDAAMGVIEAHTIPKHVLGDIVEFIAAEGLDVWLYRGTDWFVPATTAPHVEHEAFTVQFEPIVLTDLDEVVSAASGPGTMGVAKVTGVSDDHELVARVEARTRDRFGAHVSAARSQDYYLDVTHPRANKGGVVEYLSRTLGIPTAAIAVLGDMPNDVLMFARAGLSIAMGNAGREVQRAARHMTATNDEDGFAAAVHRYILPTAR